LLAGADRAADRLQAQDGLAVPLRLHLQHRLRVRLRSCVDRGAGAADSRGQGDDRQPARLAPGVVTPDRGRAQGRVARGPELDRVRARERDRLPHLYGDGARPVRRAVLQLSARASAESPTRRAPYLAEGRVPGLTSIGSRGSKCLDLPAKLKIVFPRRRTSRTRRASSGDAILRVTLL